MTGPACAAAQQPFARIDAQAGHRRFAVAGEAVGGEQRPDARLEELDGRRKGWGCAEAAGAGVGAWLARTRRADQGHHGHDQEDERTTPGLGHITSRIQEFRR